MRSANARIVRRRLRGASPAVLAAAASLAALLVVSLGLVWLGQGSTAPQLQTPLLVYCASGIRAALEPAVRQYEAEFGVPVRVQYGPTGALEAQIELAQKGDLFVPAAADPFLLRGRAAGTVQEIIPLAKFRLVLGVAPGVRADWKSFADLAAAGVPYALANADAAVGKATEQALATIGQWETAARQARVFLPTVTELADAVRQGDQVQAAPLWDATARQYGLQIVELPEFAGAESVISVGVLSTAAAPPAALRLARYLAAPEKGQPFFAADHYERLPGDAWAETPELKLFSGTVNRRAIAATLEEFQRREGCRITTIYEGCGTLVGMMRAGATPDAYLACDVSYVEQVSEQFWQPLPLSTNRLVLAVRKGNPAQLRSLDDLTRPGVRVGLCDPQLTALGDLTVRMLQEAGALSGVQANSPRTGITGDVLVAQLLASDKLDAVIVYEANCTAARDQLEIIPIDHPRATATQPFSIHRSAAYPQLSRRLEEALAAPRSRARFEAEGFTWLNP